MLKAIKRLLGRRDDEGGTVAATRFVAVDTELTGLDPRTDSIISIGAVALQGGRIEMGERFYELARPDKELTGASVVVHGITPSDLISMPGITDVMQRFREFCGESPLVGFCTDVDRPFLDAAARKAGLRKPRSDWFDTWYLYEWLRRRRAGGGEMPPAKSGLYVIARALNIDVSGAHDALMDAWITAQVFQRLLPLLSARGIDTLAGLRHACDEGEQESSRDYFGRSPQF